MCLLVTVHPKRENHLWRKNAPKGLSIDPVAAERLVRDPHEAAWPRDRAAFRRLSEALVL
jgi:hypothetical protein